MDLITVINEARLVREQYELAAIRSYPLSIDFYLDVISQYSGFKIDLMRPLPVTQWESDKIRGWINRCDGTGEAKIHVARLKADLDDQFGVTFCEQRFIIIKEACHLFLDTEATYTKSAPRLIESLIYNGPQAQSLQNMPEEYQSEVFAIIAAVELLFPWEDRTVRKERIEAGDLTYLDVAHEYKIPERFVCWVLGDKVHSSLMQVHQSLDNIKNK